MEIDYSMPSEQILLAYLNASVATGINITSSDVILEKVEAHETARTNTRATFRARNGQFTGRISFNYNRQSIRKVVDGLVLTVPFKEYDNVQQVVQDVNARYGFNISPREFVHEKLHPKQRVVSIQFREDSIFWTGEFQVLVEAPANDLARVVKNKTMDGGTIRGCYPGKYFGALLYAGIDFTPDKESLGALHNGSGFELHIRKVLKDRLGDEWVCKPGVTCEWNLSGSLVRIVEDGPFRNVEVYLSKLCSNVSGNLVLRYIP